MQVDAALPSCPSSSFTCRAAVHGHNTTSCSLAGESQHKVLPDAHVMLWSEGCPAHIMLMICMAWSLFHMLAEGSLTSHRCQVQGPVPSSTEEARRALQQLQDQPPEAAQAGPPPQEAAYGSASSSLTASIEWCLQQGDPDVRSLPHLPPLDASGSFDCSADLGSSSAPAPLLQLAFLAGHEHQYRCSYLL